MLLWPLAALAAPYASSPTTMNTTTSTPRMRSISAHAPAHDALHRWRHMASPPGMLIPVLAHGTSPTHFLHADAISSAKHSPDLPDDCLIDALIDLLPLYVPLLHECAIYFSFSKFPKGVRFRDRAPPHRSPRDIERAEIYAHLHTRVCDSRSGIFEAGSRSSRSRVRRLVPASPLTTERDGTVMGGYVHPRRRVPPPSEVFQSLILWYAEVHLYVALAILFVSVCCTHTPFLIAALSVYFLPVLCSTEVYTALSEYLIFYHAALGLVYAVYLPYYMMHVIFNVFFAPLSSAAYYGTLLLARLIFICSSCTCLMPRLCHSALASARYAFAFIDAYCVRIPAARAAEDGALPIPGLLPSLVHAICSCGLVVTNRLLALCARTQSLITQFTLCALCPVLHAHGFAARRLLVFDSIEYRLSYSRNLVAVSFRLSQWGLILLALVTPSLAGDDDKSSSSRPPLFDGTRASFTAWLMIFSGWIAWKQTDCVGIMEGTIMPPPEPPQPPEPTDPAGVSPDHPQFASITTAHNLWAVAHSEWVTAHNHWAQQYANYVDLNTKLYGAILQAVPEWLRTTLYHSHRNDGYDALRALRDQFDAQDANDHAANMARLQHKYIDAKADLSENDLRRQYDAMMTACAGITRTGNLPPDQLTLIAMFDLSLPISYSQLRQLVRRSKHRTLADHYSDYMAQVRAELSARAPSLNAFSTTPVCPSSEGNPSENPGDGGGNSGRADPICLRCGKKGHRRPKCTQRKRKCKHCGGDHLDVFCMNGPGGARRDALPQGAIKILRNDATQANASSAVGSTADTPSTAPAPAPAPAASPPAVSDSRPNSSSAHSAAAAAASACDSPEAAGQAYIAALKALGFGMCASARTAASSSLPDLEPPADCSKVFRAMVDTMATYWVVNDRSLLMTVTNPDPGFTINTANGAVRVDAVGTAFVCVFTHDKKWVCYEVPNVLLMSGCPDLLYSTRVMHEYYRIRNDVESGFIRLPASQRTESATVKITDDGASYSIPVCFARHGASIVHRSNILRSPPKALSASSPGIFPASISGTPQATLYRRLGFPDEHSWRHVTSATQGHGLPPGTVVSTTIPVSDALMRGRARKLPFTASPDKDRPAPGAVFYGDHCGPVIPSHPHRFIGYSGYVDAGSGYGRPFPCHGFTAVSATSSLDVFTADVCAKMNLTSMYKPSVVRTDQGSAFISQHFREFLSERQIQQSLACAYTPQQNSHIERFWGLIFTLARVLLASANLPPSFHPFAIQTAAWITNRLPRASRGNQSPYFILSKKLPDLSTLYSFGCLCTAAIPPARRQGDKHFADRGEPALYLGPSEISPGHVVYLLSARKVTTLPHIVVWEDQFPGLKGVNYTWFPSADAPAPLPLNSPSDSTPTPAPAEPHAESPIATAPAPSSDAPSSVADAPSSPPVDPPVSELPSEPASDLPAPDQSDTAPPSADVPLSLQRSGRNRARRAPNYFRSDNMGHANAVFSGMRHDSLVSSAIRAATFGVFAMMTLSSPARPMYGAFAFTSVFNAVDSAFDALPASHSDYLIGAAAKAAVIYSVTITPDVMDVRVPKGYKGATTGPHAVYWIAAINLELEGLIANDTWEYITFDSLPAGVNIMRCHYVFTLKRNPDGSIERFKARLVADGNTQKWGIDFNRVFSTVIRTSTLRLMLIIAAAFGYSLTQVDIKQAYLQATVTERLYMHVPEGLSNRDTKGRRLVCKLKRSIYGLRQAGREWGICLSTYLTGYGFTRSHIDTCLYILKRGSSSVWLAIYVDDIVVMDNDSSLRNQVIKDLNSRFTLTDKGVLSWILGISISRDLNAKTLSMSQELYVGDLLDRFASFLNHSRSYQSPLDEGFRIDKADMPAPGSYEHEQMKDVRPVYMSLIGGLIWLATMTRHDIAFAVSQLARVLTNPGQRHFDAAIRVLLYLKSTRNRPLEYKPNTDLTFSVFVDSDWSTNYSCSGAYFLFMGCPFHWFSKMQHSVSLSSAESEFFGAMIALKDLIFFRELLFVLNLLAQGPTPMYTDSKSAVDLSFDHIAFKNTKHVLRAANFMRDNVVKMVVALFHLPGRIMIADILTKSLPRATYIALLTMIAEYSVHERAAVADKP